MTERIREFLRNRREDGPCLVVDIDVVRDNYTKFARALPNTRVFYAVKANPAPEVLRLLARLGAIVFQPRHILQVVHHLVDEHGELGRARAGIHPGRGAGLDARHRGGSPPGGIDHGARRRVA